MRQARQATLSSRPPGAGTLLCLLCLLAAVPGPVMAQQRYIASGHPDWPPYSWQHGERIVGAGAELAELIFRDLGVTLEFKPQGNWKRTQAEAEHGNVDVVVSAYRTADRMRYLGYHATPFTEDANVVWVARGREFPYAGWDDLVGRHGTAMLGESYGEQFDRYMAERLTVSRVSSALLNLKKLEAGHADYYPFSLYAGEIQLRRFGYQDKVVHLPGVISTEGVYIAIARKSPLIRYLPQLEQAVRQRRADGTVERLLRAYVERAAQSR
jgi:polar amino acid transport system substrate-binding protein